MDIDCLFAEYDRAKPVALIEYKHESAQLFLSTDPGRRTLKALGDMAGLPVFVARYTSDFSRWKVGAVNLYALAKLGEELGLYPGFPTNEMP